MNADVCSEQELQAELAAKRERVVDYLNRSQLDAILISRHENIAWVTAGLVDVRVGLLRETGPASLLITKENRAYYLTTNNEAQRLAEEEFSGLDFQPMVRSWYANDVHASIREITGSGLVATDTPSGDLRIVSLQSLRFELGEGEVKRYRWLGKTVANAVAEVVLGLQPGMSERAIQAMLAERLIGESILPSVYLIGVDDRIRKFKHAVPKSGTLEKFGMVGLCARRWGLTVSMTRFVHFGRMPDELVQKFVVVSELNARLQAATKLGTTAADFFDIARNGFAEWGFAGEEKLHHQGGATGYLEREWFARVDGSEAACATQAFAWNPNLQGAKVEDTVLLQNQLIEVVTATPDLPVLSVDVNGIQYQSAGVLIRD